MVTLSLVAAVAMTGNDHHMRMFSWVVTSPAKIRSRDSCFPAVLCHDGTLSVVVETSPIPHSTCTVLDVPPLVIRLGLWFLSRFLYWSCSCSCSCRFSFFSCRIEVSSTMCSGLTTRARYRWKRSSCSYGSSEMTPASCNTWHSSSQR